MNELFQINFNSIEERANTITACYGRMNNVAFVRISRLREYRARRKNARFTQP